MRSILVLLAVALMASGAFGTHFRYQSANWIKDPVNDHIVTFTIDQAWRWSAYGNPAVGTIASVGVWEFGDGTPASSLDLLVTTVDPANDYFIGTATIVHTYATGVTSAEAFYASCCRISTLLDGNNDASEYISTVVKFGAGSDSRSPMVTSIPIVGMALNQPNAYQLPLVPTPGRVTTFSISPSSVSLLPTTAPAGLVLSPSGLITWTPTVAGLYAFQVTVTNTLNGVVTSTTAIDFIFEVAPGVIPNPPVFLPNADNIEVCPDTPVTFQVKASSTTLNAVVSISTNNLPVGATLSPCAEAAGPTCTRTFNWTPSGQSTSFTLITATNVKVNGGPTVSSTTSTKTVIVSDCIADTYSCDCKAVSVSSDGNEVTLSFDSSSSLCPP